MSKYKTSVTRRLTDKGIAHPSQSFIPAAIQYETMMGSIAYGVSSDSSDVDIYGFTIPPKEVIFPHTAGYINGFSKDIPKFDQYQEHHLFEPDRRKTYDLSIFNIVKYFRLLADNNPNVIDSIFTAHNMILTISPVGELVRDNRKLFLHRGCWHRFKGYAYAQMQKMKVKEPDKESSRYEMVQKYGYDVKFAYHVVRLLNEVEMILTEGDLDLMRNNDQLKSIRKGDWALKDVEDYFFRKERDLETLYTNSKLRYSADEDALRDLLLKCLETYYGSLGKAITMPDKYEKLILKIKNLLTDA